MLKCLWYDFEIYNELINDKQILICAETTFPVPLIYIH